LGLVATLVEEGMEKSQRVFSAKGSGADGAWTTGLVAKRTTWGGTMQGRTLLTSFSAFSMKFVSKEKPVIHYSAFIHQEKTKATLAYISSSYLLNT
jgi:hypothetical protein